MSVRGHKGGLWKGLGRPTPHPGVSSGILKALGLPHQASRAGWAHGRPWQDQDRPGQQLQAPPCQAPQDQAARPARFIGW